MDAKIDNIDLPAFDAEAALAAATKAIEILEERIEDLEAEVAELSLINVKQPNPSTAAPKLPAIPEETFKVAGNTYKFNAPTFRHPVTLEHTTAEEALTNQPLLDHLVELQAGIISQVNKTSK